MGSKVSRNAKEKKKKILPTVTLAILKLSIGTCMCYHFGCNGRIGDVGRVECGDGGEVLSIEHA